MAMSGVWFRRCEYEPYASLRTAVGELLDGLGLPRAFAGDPVLLKPNLLMPAAPQTAVMTHPLVVRAAVEWVLDRGGRPMVADSPARGGFAAVAAQGGFDRALRGLAVTLRPFESSVTVDAGEPFGRIEVAREAVETETVLNLAKLKTHSQMRLTLGVKNLFGCIVGLRKPEWHLRSGVDRDTFARLLVQIHSAVAPSATLIDGVLAMEGAGPGTGGRPRRLGVLAAGASAVAADAAVCRMLALDPQRLPTWRAARDLGLATEPRIQGDFTVVSDFDFPSLGPVFFGPPLLHGLVRRHLLNRPRVDTERCRLCDECRNYCPAGAVHRFERRMHFDLAACIRCFCCVEVCPHGALESYRPPAGRALARLNTLAGRLRPGH